MKQLNIENCHEKFASVMHVLGFSDCSFFSDIINIRTLVLITTKSNL